MQLDSLDRQSITTTKQSWRPRCQPLPATGESPRLRCDSERLDVSQAFWGSDDVRVRRICRSHTGTHIPRSPRWSPGFSLRLCAQRSVKAGLQRESWPYARGPDGTSTRMSGPLALAGENGWHFELKDPEIRVFHTLEALPATPLQAESDDFSHREIRLLSVADPSSIGARGIVHP